MHFSPQTNPYRNSKISIDKGNAMVKYFTICRTPEAQIEHTDIKHGIQVTTTYQVFKMNAILQVLSIINLPLCHSVSEVSFQIALFLFLPIYFDHGELPRLGVK